MGIIDRFYHKSIEPNYFEQLEMEISTRCPVRCPLCPRTNPINGDKSWNTGFLDKDHILNFISQSHIKKIMFCGGYGDPIYHPDFIEIMKTLGEKFPDTEVTVETNGSYMKEEWWKRLGQVTTKKHRFSFSIDGLEDTNPIYRVNADWKSIISGLRVFRKYHPGTMQWKWILFRHNQHQVEEGFRLSKELGFDLFKLVDSHRHTDLTRPTIAFNDVEKNLETLSQESMC